MKTCANCASTYSLEEHRYRCVRKNRPEIFGVFLLGRYCCKDHQPCKELEEKNK